MSNKNMTLSSAAHRLRVGVQKNLTDDITMFVFPDYQKEKLRVAAGVFSSRRKTTVQYYYDVTLVEYEAIKNPEILYQDIARKIAMEFGMYEFLK
jgi:hypothetical protein